MLRFGSRPGAVYRGTDVETITASRMAASEDYQSGNAHALAQGLDAIAHQAGGLTLWSFVVVTLVAFLTTLFMLFKVREWQHFDALSLALTFFTVSGCAGAYLISIKGGGSQR